MENITDDSSFKRWAVVSVGKRSRQSFRVWHKTKEAAEAVAIDMFAEGRGSLYLVLETVAMIGKPEELPRKHADIIYNDSETVMARRLANGDTAGRKAMMAHLADQIMKEDEE